MNRFVMLAAVSGLLGSGAVAAQDLMKFGLPGLTVAAEDAKVRVLHYVPHKGVRSPMHSHPETIVYVIKGGRLRYTFPDGTTKVATLKTGETVLRAPITHSDEALDDIEVLIVELKP